MWRQNLITKETLKNYCKEEENAKDSVNDELESLLEDIRLGKEPAEHVGNYFFQKLTEEEMELVEKEDTNHLQTFVECSPDVEESEIILSESDSKYVNGWVQRRTFSIENSSPTNICNWCPLK